MVYLVPKLLWLILYMYIEVCHVNIKNKIQYYLNAGKKSTHNQSNSYIFNTYGLGIYIEFKRFPAKKELTCINSINSLTLRDKLLIL